MSRSWAVVAALAGLLAGCQSLTTDKPIPLAPPAEMEHFQKVDVPIPQGCQTPAPTHDPFPDDDAALKAAYAELSPSGEHNWSKVVNLLAAAKKLKDDYIARLERAFQSCK